MNRNVRCLLQIRDKKVKAAGVVAARLPAAYSKSSRWPSPTSVVDLAADGRAAWASSGSPTALSHGF